MVWARGTAFHDLSPAYTALHGSRTSAARLRAIGQHIADLAASGPRTEKEANSFVDIRLSLRASGYPAQADTPASVVLVPGALHQGGEDRGDSPRDAAPWLLTACRGAGTQAGVWLPVFAGCPCVAAYAPAGSPYSASGPAARTPPSRRARRAYQTCERPVSRPPGEWIRSGNRRANQPHGATRKRPPPTTTVGPACERMEEAILMPSPPS